MLGSLTNIVNRTDFQDFVQNTSKAVTVETGLKAIGRPSFTLIDKSTDKETRKYSATREFIYQTLCLALYLGVLPIFKRYGFNTIRKNLKNEEAFKKIPDYAKYEWYAKKHGEEKISKKYPLVKGAAELSSIIGSALTLTLIAPGIVNMLVHPIMNALGMKKKNEAKEPCGCGESAPNFKGLNTVK